MDGTYTAASELPATTSATFNLVSGPTKGTWQGAQARACAHRHLRRHTRAASPCRVTQPSMPSNCWRRIAQQILYRVHKRNWVWKHKQSQQITCCLWKEFLTFQLPSQTPRSQKFISTPPPLDQSSKAFSVHHFSFFFSFVQRDKEGRSGQSGHERVLRALSIHPLNNCSNPLADSLTEL